MGRSARTMPFMARRVNHSPDVLLPSAQPGVARCTYRYRLTRGWCVRAVPRCIHYGSHCGQQRLSGATSADRYPRVTAKLREALDKQVAKREKNQSINSYAMDFLNAVGVHNDTSMAVESRILELHRAAKQSMDWTAGGAQFHSPTLHAFLNGLYHNADKDD
eukprot:694312-Pleurochrysis_carterae.AAC.1